MSLLTSGAASATGFGFIIPKNLRLNTGAEQTVTVSGSGAIQLADGNIITGAYIQAGFPSTQGLRYKSLTVTHSTAIYGAEQSLYFANCSGGSFNVGNFAAGNILSGVQISVGDGADRYTGYGYNYYKSFGFVYSNSINWSAALLSPLVQTNVWTNVPGTTVVNGTTVNICTGQRYFVGGGACGRLTYADINHQLYYRTLTVS